MAPMLLRLSGSGPAPVDPLQVGDGLGDADEFIRELVLSGNYKFIASQLGVLASLCKTNVHVEALTSMGYMRKCKASLPDT